MTLSKTSGLCGLLLGLAVGSILGSVLTVHWDRRRFLNRVDEAYKTAVLGQLRCDNVVDECQRMYKLYCGFGTD